MLFRSELMICEERNLRYIKSFSLKFEGFLAKCKGFFPAVFVLYAGFYDCDVSSRASLLLLELLLVL